MERSTFKSFIAAQGITAVAPAIRQNTNGYPFITVLRGSGPESAENIYFSVKASAEVSEGQAVKSIAKDLYVVNTLNAAGEARTKLSFAGESSYLGVDELF